MTQGHARLVPLAMILVAACAGTPRPVEAPAGPQAILGYWALADTSHTIMRIERGGPAPSGLRVTAWATDSDVAYEVSDITWDGKRLKATFRYPPSDVSTTSTLNMVHRDRLEGFVNGPYSGRETWLRTEAQAPKPPS